MQLANDPTPIGMVAKLGFLESLDTPGLDHLKKAARKLLVAQGLLEPEEGEEPPPPPEPNPKDVADAEKSASQAALNAAKAEGQQIDNVVKLASFSPPVPIGPAPMPNQPPPGGFFMPDQGAAPGGFPGLPM